MYPRLREEMVQFPSVKRIPSFLILSALMLASCSGSNRVEEPVSGGKSATVLLDMLAKATERPRPSGTMGVFSSLYVSQGIFFPTAAAPRALSDLLRIVQGQENPLSDASYALLRVLGDILSEDVADLLNRSDNRIAALDLYTESLGNVIISTKTRVSELTTALDRLATARKERRTAVSDLTREQKKAIDAKDFSTAAALEQDLLAARRALAETELTESQTKDMQSRLKKLLEIAEQRKAAIESNREILISGLSVTDLPGLTDLGLVEKR